jgi:hypothetical protein
MTPLVLQYVLMALQALPSLVAAGNSINAEVQTLQAQLKLFAAENRDPSPSEWATQNAALVAALTNLQNAKPAH